MNYRTFLDCAKPLDMVKFRAVRPIYQPMAFDQWSEDEALPITTFEVEELTMSGTLLHLDERQCKLELISGDELVVDTCAVTGWYPR
jgi:hypothetical protein